jgi:hypothetical protein
MKKETHFGIICDEKDDRIIIRTIKQILLTDGYPGIGKSTAIAKMSLPRFCFKYVYYSLTKALSLSLTLEPNKDTLAVWQYPAHKEASWILVVRIVDKHYYDVDNGFNENKTESYIKKILDALPFEKVVLTEKDT